MWLWDTYTFCFQMESCARIDTDRFNVQSVQTGDWCVNYESKSTPEMGHTPHVPLEIKHLCTTPLTQPGVKRQSCSPPLPNTAAVRAMHASRWTRSHKLRAGWETTRPVKCAEVGSSIGLCLESFEQILAQRFTFIGLWFHSFGISRKPVLWVIHWGLYNPADRNKRGLRELQIQG